MARQMESMVLWRQANALMSLEDLAEAAAVPTKRVEKLVGFGLIEASIVTRSGPLFSATSVERLRRILRLRRDLGINLSGIAVVLDLRDRIENLQRETRRLRGRLGLAD